jgi:hypothetical protein
VKIAGKTGSAEISADFPLRSTSSKEIFSLGFNAAEKFQLEGEVLVRRSHKFPERSHG